MWNLKVTPESGFVTFVTFVTPKFMKRELPWQGCEKLKKKVSTWSTYKILFLSLKFILIKVKGFTFTHLTWVWCWTFVNFSFFRSNQEKILLLWMEFDARSACFKMDFNFVRNKSFPCDSPMINTVISKYHMMRWNAMTDIKVDSGFGLIRS